jgi:hypothetical protein
MSMADVKHIAALGQIPADQPYVLVMYGEENGHSRHSRRMTITVVRNPAADLDELGFSQAVESAKSIAENEHVSTVYVYR